jgi:hypothetical protein
MAIINCCWVDSKQQGQTKIEWVVSVAVSDVERLKTR